jgi:hypothetical protein
MRLFWLVTLLVLVGIVLSYVDINLQRMPDTELYFKSYDIQTNGSACFSYSSFTHNISLEVNENSRTIQDTGSYCIAGDSLLAGDNLVRLKADERSIFFHVNKSELPKTTQHFAQKPADTGNDKNPLLMLIASIFVFFLPGIFITQRFFKAKDSMELLSLSLAFSIMVTFITSWVLNFLGISNQLAFFCIIGIVSLAFYKRKARLPKIKNKEIAIVLAFILLTVLAQLFMFSHNSPWSVYYDRQIESTYNQKSLVDYDPLSYLGRPFTFVPGYILTKAAFSWMSSTSPQETFFIFQLIGNLFLLSSIFYLGRTLKFSDRKITIVIMFIFSSLFIFGWLVIALLHLYAFALFLTALALALNNRKSSGVLAGVAGIFHVSFLLAFPVLLFALQKKADIQKIAVYSIIAASVFLLFYSPTLVQHGWPSEIQQEDWGYLIKGNIINLGTMSAGFLSIAVIPALYFGLKRNRKLTLVTLAMILAFLFVSYRFNFFLAVLVSILFVSTFKLTNRYVIAVVSLLFLLSFGLNLTIYNGESLNSGEIAPFVWLQAVSDNQSRILVEPFFGHVSNYYSQRPSLADLYVEYASDEKYTDEMGFINSGRMDVLEKWNITYAVTLHAVSITRIAEFKYYPDEIEFKSLDKPYTNLYFNVHYRRQA